MCEVKAELAKTNELLVAQAAVTCKAVSFLPLWIHQLVKHTCGSVSYLAAISQSTVQYSVNAEGDEFSVSPTVASDRTYC